MPTYDYRCKACGQELEVFQSFSDDPLTTCDACGGELRKLFGAPGIAFKGSGFYKTDSRGSARSTSSSESSTSEKVGGDKAGGDKAGSDKAGGDSSSNGSAPKTKEPAASAASSDS